MLNDSIYLNPSFVSFLPSYSVAGNYLYFQGASDAASTSAADPHGHAVNVSLQDGRSELFQAGVGLTLLDDRKTINIGASKSVVNRFGVGVGGKFVLPNTDSPHPIYDTLISVTGVPMDWLQLAAILDNVVESEDGRAYGLYREYILGTKVNIKGIVLLYFDPHLAPHAPDTFGHELGLEFPILTDFFLRVGNFRNANVSAINLRGNGYAAGLGWIGPRISFDYAFQRVLAPVLATSQNFGMTVYF